MLKLLWNLCAKKDNLWVRWIHSYYMKNDDIMDCKIKDNGTWIMKRVMGTREYIQVIQSLWEAMLCAGKFSMKSVYSQLRSNEPVVSWKSLTCKTLPGLELLSHYGSPVITS